MFLNVWHGLYYHHSHLAKGDEEIVICCPRFWWLPGKVHYMYSHQNSEYIEVTRLWLERLIKK